MSSISGHAEQVHAYVKLPNKRHTGWAANDWSLTTPVTLPRAEGYDGRNVDKADFKLQLRVIAHG